MMADDISGLPAVSHQLFRILKRTICIKK